MGKMAEKNDLIWYHKIVFFFKYLRHFSIFLNEIWYRYAEQQKQCSVKIQKFLLQMYSS